MTDGRDSDLNSLEFAAAGAVSAFVTRFSCQPLDVLKILFQLQTSSKAVAKYTSLPQAVSLIVKEEGITALWKGHIAAQCLSVAYGGIQFSTYEKILDVSQRIRGSKQSILMSDTALNFYAGGASGVIAISLSFPLDTVRTRLIAQPKSKLYKGVFDASKQIWKQEGTKGFFRGLFPACAQIAPSSALVFGFKNIYTQIWHFCMFDTSDSFQIAAKGHLVTGILAGITSKSIVYPLDVVKKRLQIQGMDESSLSVNTKSQYKGVLDCIVLILKHEGLLGLYKGFLPAALKSGIANGINFAAYNEVCKFLDMLKMKS